MAGSRIKGITVEIDGNVTGLEKALKSVNTTIKNTQSQLKDVERLLKLDPSHTELLSQKQGLLKEKISATKEKLDALKQAQEQAKQQMESGDLGKDKYDALQREIIETEQELQKLAREAAEANTALNKIDSVGKTMENVGGKMSSVGSSLTRYVTAPIVALGTAAVKTTADFDASMSQVAAVSGATGKEFDALREKAREMGAKTKFSASEAADAFNYMAMAGWKTGDMLDGIEGIMNLAAASGEDLATTSDIVTDALTAFGLKAKDSGHFADVLAAASANANTNVSMLGESFKYAAPVAGALGISAEDTSIALGLMANAGIKASQSGTALRTGLTNLAKPTKQMQTYMDKYSISLKQNDDGSINLRDTMIDLRAKMGNLSESEQAAAASAIFGKNSMAGWLAIINASDEDFEKLTSAIDNCDGAAEDMATTMQNNLAGQITILKSALQELAIQIGDALMPTIRNIVSKIQAFVEKLQQMDEGTRNTIIKIAAFAAAIGPVLVVVGKLTTGVGKGLQAISSLGKGILTFVNQAKLGVGAGGKLAAAISGISAPVAAVIAAIALLVAAFVHLWKNNEEFRNKVTAIWESVKAKFQAVAQKITDAINSLGFNFEDLGKAISAAWDWLCNALEPIVTAVIQNIGDTIESVIDIVGGVIQVIVGLIKGFKDGDWSTFLSGISDLFTGVINGLLAPFRAIFSLFGIEIGKFDGDWGKLWENIKSVFETVWNAIKNFFIGIWEGIKSAVSTAVNVVSTAITTAWNAVSGFFKTIWESIKSFFEGIWNGITGAVSTATATVSNTVSTAWNTVKGIFETVWNAIKSFFEGIWNGIKTVVATVTGVIGTTVSTAWNGVKTTFETVWNGISGFFSGIWDGLKNTVSTVTSTISTGISNAWNGIKSVSETVWNGISGFFGGIWDGIKSTVSSTIDGIKSGVETGWNAIKSTTENVWNGTKTFVSTTWDNIKTSVGGFVDGIKDKVSTVWTNIKDKVSGVMDGLKQGISEKWEAAKNAVATTVDTIKSGISEKWENIKNAVSSTAGNIKDGLSEKWNAAKTSVSTIVDGIKTNVSTGWNNIKTAISPVMEGIKSGIKTGWEAAKTSVSTTLDGIKNSVSNAWNSVKSTTSNIINGVKNTISTGFNAAKQSVTNIFGGIKQGISNALQSASQTVSNLIQSIRSKFNFSWSLPRLKLPHVSITGSFSLNPPSIPHFSVSWYKKAMENGMILNSPTIFGQKGNTLLAGGEAGSEAVVGTQSLMEMIRNAVASMANQTTINYGGVNINVYQKENQDIRALADEIEYRINNNLMRRKAAVGV